MLLYLIRHGAPDYAADSLREEGRAQARKAANRLAKGGIHEIHSSPMGRARQTAEPAADKLGLPVIIEPWAFELGEECMTTFPDGKKKTIAALPPEYLHQAAFRRMDSQEGLRKIPAVAETGLGTRWEALINGLDGMLEKLGFRRNADGLYDVIAPDERHIALFCHAGMLCVVLAHLLDLPYHLLASSMLCPYTGITVLDFPAFRPAVSPVLLTFGDVGHLYDSDALPQSLYASGRQF